MRLDGGWHALRDVTPAGATEPPRQQYGSTMAIATDHEDLGWRHRR